MMTMKMKESMIVVCYISFERYLNARLSGFI